METPELNDDIRNIVLGLMGDRVTFLSKVLRHKYFKENGIWINFSSPAFKSLKSFPQAFYEYDVNLNFKNAPLRLYESYLEHRLAHLGEDLIRHVEEKTISAKYTTIDYLERFPNLRKIKHVTGSKYSLKYLEKNKLAGCDLVITWDNLDDLIQMIKNIDCKISIYVPHDRYKDVLLDKIVYCNSDSLIPGEKYPNIKMIDCSDDVVPNTGQYPQLKMLQYNRLTSIDVLHNNFPHITKLFPAHAVDITSEIYQKIIKYGYRQKIYLYDDNDANKLWDYYDIYGSNHNITLTCLCDKNMTARKVTELLLRFNVDIYLGNMRYDDVIYFLSNVFCDPRICGKRRFVILLLDYVPDKYQDFVDKMSRKDIELNFRISLDPYYKPYSYALSYTEIKNKFC